MSVPDRVHGWTVEYAKSGRSKCKARARPCLRVLRVRARVAPKCGAHEKDGALRRRRRMFLLAATPYES